MAKWTKEELIQADSQVEIATMQDSHDELHAAYKAVAVERTCQRNRALAALKIGRFYCHAYGELSEEISLPCSTVPEDLQQIDAAIALTGASCNRHDDCDKAVDEWKTRNPGRTIPASFHCHDDECEECFGN